MTNTRNIAFDATFMVTYIGFTAAMVTLSVALVALLTIGTEFGLLHAAASAINLLGWSLLPFAPRLYRSLIGQSFDWRSNGVLGG